MNLVLSAAVVTLPAWHWPLGAVLIDPKSAELQKFGVGLELLPRKLGEPGTCRKEEESASGQEDCNPWSLEVGMCLALSDVIVWSVMD